MTEDSNLGFCSPKKYEVSFSKMENLPIIGGEIPELSTNIHNSIVQSCLSINKVLRHWYPSTKSQMIFLPSWVQDHTPMALSKAITQDADYIAALLSMYADITVPGDSIDRQNPPLDARPEPIIEFYGANILPWEETTLIPVPFKLLEWTFLSGEHENIGRDTSGVIKYNSILFVSEYLSSILTTNPTSINNMPRELSFLHKYPASSNLIITIIIYLNFSYRLKASQDRVIQHEEQEFFNVLNNWIFSNFGSRPGVKEFKGREACIVELRRQNTVESHITADYIEQKIFNRNDIPVFFETHHPSAIGLVPSDINHLLREVVSIAFNEILAAHMLYSLPHSARDLRHLKH